MRYRCFLGLRPIRYPRNSLQRSPHPIMAASPFSDDLDFMNWASESTPAVESPTEDIWGELENLLTEPGDADLDADIGESELPLPSVESLFGEPEVAPSDVVVSSAKELTLPPPLWAEIEHLFQTPAFNEATPNQPANPAIASEIDTLSQAMLANDRDTIQALVQQIQETYDELKSIEIFLAATRNLCY